uniref:Uncharacterized protein n=1 Tax=Anguilla anguilla TaxID=7936 RepID=A0A0E9WIL8_ANGAN
MRNREGSYGVLFKSFWLQRSSIETISCIIKYRVTCVYTVCTYTYLYILNDCTVLIIPLINKFA